MAEVDLVTDEVKRAWNVRQKEILCEEIQRVMRFRAPQIMKRVKGRMRKELGVLGQKSKRGELSSLTEEQVLSTIRELFPRSDA